MGQGFGPGDQYILRYHQAPNPTGRLDMAILDARSAAWSGFRYRHSEISILMVLEGPDSAKA